MLSARKRKRIMPDFTPPWSGADVTVRKEYAAGTWAYALGRPAWEHRRYKKACQLFEAQGINPWWIRTYNDVTAVLEGCWFSEELALWVVEYFETHLVHSKGQWAGQPFVLLDWQQYDVIMPLFGWVRPDGARRFRRALIWIPKKNGKSALASGLGLYLLDGDEEPGAEVYAAAVDTDQAQIVFSEAERMVRASDVLSERLKVIPSTKRIVTRDLLCLFKALSADSKKHEGLNIHGALIDEIHAHPNADLWDTLYYGGAARTQPLLFSISTAGDYDETSVGWQQYEYTTQVLDTTVTDLSLFGYVCDAAKDADWQDPAVWLRANPSLGAIISLEDMKEKCNEARQKPTQQAQFKMYRLNIWTQQRDPWMDVDRWRACAATFKRGERKTHGTLRAKLESELAGRPCYAALDLSLSDDITAKALWFPPQEEGERHRVLLDFWIPEDNVTEKGTANKASYAVWVDQGYLHTTPGDWVDYDAVRQALADDADRYEILEVGYDRWNATSIVQDLIEDGFTLEKIGQGYGSMNAPTKEFERLVMHKELEHEANRVMQWQIANARAVYNPAGDVKLTKTNSQRTKRYKIDGVIAAIMGLSRVLANETQPSVYETRGIVTI
jgi:phage terminase large subunit-like protein